LHIAIIHIKRSIVNGLAGGVQIMLLLLLSLYAANLITFLSLQQLMIIYQIRAPYSLSAVTNPLKQVEGRVFPLHNIECLDLASGLLHCILSLLLAV
jgi:hypothetical protein